MSVSATSFEAVLDVWPAGLDTQSATAAEVRAKAEGQANRIISAAWEYVFGVPNNFTVPVSVRYDTGDRLRMKKPSLVAFFLLGLHRLVCRLEGSTTSMRPCAQPHRRERCSQEKDLHIKPPSSAP